MSPRAVLLTLSVGLTLSICANAFLFGVAVGHPHEGAFPFARMALEDHDELPPPPSDDDREHKEKHDSDHDQERGPDHVKDRLRAFLKDLPDDVRAPLSETLKNSRPIMDAGVSELKVGNQEIADVIKATPFNPEALRAALAKQRDTQKGMQAAIHDKLVDTLSSMTPEQRAVVSENARRVFR